MRSITTQQITSFKHYLTEEAKSKNTIEKYIRDVKAFYNWIKGQLLSKSMVLEYKAEMTETCREKELTKEEYEKLLVAVFLLSTEHKKHSPYHAKKCEYIVPSEVLFQIQHREQRKDYQGDNLLDDFQLCSREVV